MKGLMKYISLAIFIALLAFTWKLSTHEDVIGVQTHHSIQMDLAKIIQAAVVQQLPGTSNFRFTKLFTEAIDDSNVKALFAYAFIDNSQSEKVERSIDGDALVSRDPSNPSQWILSQIHVGQSTIEFEEGSVVTAGTDLETAPSTSPAPAPAEHQ
jgi:hypothetical protein